MTRFLFKKLLHNSLTRPRHLKTIFNDNIFSFHRFFGQKHKISVHRICFRSWTLEICLQYRLEGWKLEKKNDEWHKVTTKLHRVLSLWDDSDSLWRWSRNEKSLCDTDTLDFRMGLEKCWLAVDSESS